MGQAIAKLWNEPLVQLAVGLVILTILVIVGEGIRRRLRPGSSQQDPTGPSQQEQLAKELLAKSQELHSQGGLSDAEFRTIKTKLAAQIQGELKDNGETG